MKDKLKGKVLIVLIVALNAMLLGCVCGMTNIVEKTNNIIPPISLTDENNKANNTNTTVEINNTTHTNTTNTTNITQNNTNITNNTNNTTANNTNSTNNTSENIIEQILNKNITIVGNNTTQIIPESTQEDVNDTYFK